MFDYLLKTVAPRAVQDLITAGVGYLTLHGYITADQQQSLIGSLFFIVMLVVNRYLGDKRKETAAVKGGEAVATVASDTFTKDDVKAIVKTAGAAK